MRTGKRPPRKQEPKHLKGYAICKRFNEIRLVRDSERDGVISSQEAFDLAKKRNEDLICITENANPPVCIIQEYSKFLYDEKKREKEQKKKSKVLGVKEIRLSPNIGDGDFNTKVNQSRGFLEKGHDVKLAMLFKGRQNQHADLGFDTINDFIDELSDISEVINKPKKEGRWLRAQVKPLKK